MRSRTPTGAEMKHDSSLEVPSQIRSASFDEMQLKPSSSNSSHSEVSSSGLVPENRQSFLLKVPHIIPKRSKSFDSGCDEPDDQYSTHSRKRPSSLEKAANYCVHCAYLEQLEKKGSLESRSQTPPTSISFTISSFCSSNEELDEQEWSDNDISDEELREVICGIKFTLSPNSPSSPPNNDPNTGFHLPFTATRRKLSSPKLERQPAVNEPSIDLESLSKDNSFDTSDGGFSQYGSQLLLGSSSEYGDMYLPSVVIAGGSEPSMSRRPSMSTLRGTRSAEYYKSQEHAAERDSRLPHSDIFLSVPGHRDRAVSLDLDLNFKSSIDDQNSTGMIRSRSLEPTCSFKSDMYDERSPSLPGRIYKTTDFYPPR